jgi:hypothetical protein
MKGSILLGVAAAAAILALPAAGAKRAVDPVRLDGPQVPRVFPHGVIVELNSPPTYERGTVSGLRGSWVGPQYWPSEKPSLRGRTSIEWTVKFDTHSPSPRAAALAGSTRGWPYLRKDPIAVPHVVGNHVVGTLIGYTALDRGDPPEDASYEGVLAFPAAHHAYVIVDFVLEHPPSDSAGDAGTYFVNGSVRPSVWEQGQAFWSFAGVRLRGNLPPRHVKLAVSDRRRLRGRVVDRFRHPLVRVRVDVQRRTKHGWRKAARARTNLHGRFSLRVDRRGLYRAVARLGKSAVQSRRVLAGASR